MRLKLRYSLLGIEPNTKELIVSRLGRLWETWKVFARALGDLVGRVLLTLFYVIVFAPFGIGVRLLADPLRIKAQERSRWNARHKFDDSLDRAGRLF